MVAAVDTQSEADPKRSVFARIVFWFDRWLRHLQSVFEYSASPRCVFRAQFDRSKRTYVFADDAHIRSGARIINLHFWNEQIPILSRHASVLGWGLQIQRSLAFSLSELARYLASRPQLADVAAVRIIITITASDRTGQIHRMLARLGFENARAEAAARHHAILQLPENIYITLLALAQNPQTVRRDTLRRQRTEVFLLRGELDRRYGHRSPPGTSAQSP
jgi:hypothetical protein